MKVKQSWDADWSCYPCNKDLRGETGRAFYVLQGVKVCPECVDEIVSELKNKESECV